jgi:hypothetical protein
LDQLEKIDPFTTLIATAQAQAHISPDLDPDQMGSDVAHETPRIRRKS